MSALAKMMEAQGLPSKFSSSQSSRESRNSSTDPRGSRHNGSGTTRPQQSRWGGSSRSAPERTFTTSQVIDLVGVALGGLRTNAITTPAQNQSIVKAIHRVLLAPQRTGRDERESRVEDYRQMQQHIGAVNFGTCPGIVLGESPKLATPESAEATLTDADKAAGDWRQIAHNDPFYQYFLATQPYRGLVKSKDTFSTNERAWQMRDLPQLSFVGQFYFCMREMDQACGNYYQRTDTCRNFIDIGCAPGGFLQCLLDFDPQRQGIGLTLATDTSKGHASGAHEMDQTLMEVLNDTPRFKLLFQDVTDAPTSLHYSTTGQLLGNGAAPQFDLAIAGARFSGKGSGEKDDAERGGDRAQEKLITAQFLVALQNLKPGGDMVVVLNTTPLAMNMQPLCFLRSCFTKLVALKPKSNFKYRSSFYMSCFGYDPLKMYPNVPQANPLLASIEIQKLLKETFDRLMNGEDRDHCNAPIGDANNESLCSQHSTSLHQLLGPLWQFQGDCIRELLDRDTRGGGYGNRNGGGGGGGYGFGR
jgi:23S rRNA U2552 (ribose-2'-O)-methylase RlmE/FtsJ